MTWEDDRGTAAHLKVGFCPAPKPSEGCRPLQKLQEDRGSREQSVGRCHSLGPGASDEINVSRCPTGYLSGYFIQQRCVEHLTNTQNCMFRAQCWGLTLSLRCTESWGRATHPAGRGGILELSESSHGGIAVNPLKCVQESHATLGEMAQKVLDV